MAQVVVELSGDDAKLFRSYQRIIEQSRKLDESHAKVKRSGQETGRQLEQSFGGKAAASLATYAGGMATLAGAVGTVRAALQQVRQESLQAMAGVEGLAASRTKLLQISNLDPKVNQELNTLADRLAATGIDRSQARDLVFSAGSEHYRGHEAELAKLARAEFMSVGSIAKAAGQVRGIYGGQFTPVAAVAGVSAAAAESRLSVEEFMEVLPKLAAGGKVAGASAPETMGLLSVLATEGDEVARYVSTFAAKMGTTKGFEGMGLLGITEKLAAMPESRRSKLVGGSKSDKLAYMWITDQMEAIRERSQVIEAAMGDSESFVGRVEATAFSPSTFEGRLRSAAVEARATRIQSEISAESRLAEGGFARESAVQRYRTGAGERGVNPAVRYMTGKGLEIGAEMGIPPGALEMGGRAAEYAPPLAVAELIWQASRGILRATGALESAADNLEGATESNRQRAAVAVQPE